MSDNIPAPTRRGSGAINVVTGAFTFASNRGRSIKGSRKMETTTEVSAVEHEFEEHSGSSGSEASFQEEEPWIAAFIDLIYVATIMNISHFVTLCGAYFNVWLLAAAYFLLMFMTRYNIDMYSICFLANDIIHRLIFLFYCLGVFIMTLNIAQMHGVSESSEGESADEGHRYLSTSPLGDDHERKDTKFLGNCTFYHDYVYGFAAGFAFTRVAIVTLYCMSIRFSHNKDNIKEYVIKMLPCLLSLCVMFFAFGLWSPVILYPVTALVEFLANVIPEFILKIRFKAKSEPLQERLGLYFMLVLGESMIGLLTVAPNPDTPGKTYSVLIFSFLLVFSIGMQFFDTVHRNTEIDGEAREAGIKAIHDSITARYDIKMNEVLKAEDICDEHERKDRRHALKHGEFREEMEKDFTAEHEELDVQLAKNPYEHALESSNPLHRVCFVWGHSTICFFMLIATNGFVNLYYEVNGTPASGDTATNNQYGDSFKISAGLFVVVVMMVIMRGFHRKVGFLGYMRKDWKRICFKMMMACLHLVVYKFGVNPSFCLVIHSGVAFFNNFIEVVWTIVIGFFFGQHAAEEERMEELLDDPNKKELALVSTNKSGRARSSSAENMSASRENMDSFKGSGSGSESKNFHHHHVYVQGVGQEHHHTHGSPPEHHHHHVTKPDHGHGHSAVVNHSGSGEYASSAV